MTKRQIEELEYQFVMKGMVEMEYKMKYEEYELVEDNE